MKLCKKCRRTLPLLVAYVAFLAAILAFVTGVLSNWHVVAVTAVFFGGIVVGGCYVTACSCRLCRVYRHPLEHHHA